MITQFYNVENQKLVGQPREGWYTVDGKPGLLPQDIVQLEIIELPQPELGSNQVANRATDVIDLDARTLTRGWTVETVEPHPWRVGKGTIMDRIEVAGALPSVMAVFAAQSAEDQFRWTNNPWFWSTNSTLRQLCAALGLDADAILAPDPFL